MIAAFTTEPNILHVVYLVVLKGFKVKAHGYCNATANAADGTLQVPEWAFDGRSSFGHAFLSETFIPCPKCVAAMQRLREPQR